MSRARESLARDALIYGAGIGLNRLAGFLMLPIYTSYLTPSDYGVLELLSTTIELIGTIAGVGIVSGVFKFHAQFDDPTDKREVVSTAALAITGLTAVASSLGVMVAEPLNALVFPDGESLPLYFRLVFITHLFRQAELVPLLLLRVRRQPVLFVTMSLLKLVLMLGLNIYFVVGRDMGLLGVLLGNLVATGVSATILGAYLVRTVGLGFSGQKFRRMLKFGYPLVFWFLGSFVFVFSDRYFLNHFASTAAVGTYALAYRFVMVLSAVGFQPFNTAWDPRRFELARGDDSGPTFRRAFTFMNVLLGVIALGLGLFTREVLLLMAGNPEFYDAYRVLPLLLAAQVLYHWGAYANLGLIMNERTPSLAGLAVVGAAIVVGLNFWLIPVYGALGAATATLIAYAIRFVAMFILSQREVRLTYDWWAVSRLYVFVGAAIGAKLLWGPESIPAALVFGALLTAAVIALIWTTVLRSDERTILLDNFRIRFFRARQ